MKSMKDYIKEVIARGPELDEALEEAKAKYRTNEKPTAEQDLFAHLNVIRSNGRGYISPIDQLTMYD